VLSCALFSVVTLAALLVAPVSEADAQEASGDPGQAVAAEAQGWVGTGYYAYDCSAFTSAVLGEFGVSLADSPVSQYASGVPSGAKAGDLVFFSEYGTGITHVGIATGYGTMVHSSNYWGTVVESPIDSVPGYVGAVDVV
jgi:cell wall-associated NlpC family hydrolase